MYLTKKHVSIWALCLIFCSFEVKSQYDLQCNNAIECGPASSHKCPHLTVDCLLDDNEDGEYILIPNDCFLSVDGILKRTMKFNNLLHQRIESPDEYCENIELMLDLDIAMLKSTAIHWGTQNHTWWDNLCQMVCDINKAYDCVGKLRPILSFSNFEFVDSGVSWYKICDQVLEEFEPELTELGLWPYPYSHFDIERIRYTDHSESYEYCSPNCGSPDISKIEARMYMFFLARRFINCGFGAIDMADIKKYTKNDPTHAISYDLIQRIKSYGEDVNDGRQFLIGGGPEKLKVEGTNLLLFDYVFSPMRPIESEDYFPSENACHDDPLQAYIDTNGYYDVPFNDVGGITPGGCDIDGCLPILLDFDHHSGVVGETPGQVDDLPWSTYGYDESTWWSNLSLDCKIDFISYYYCNLDDEVNCRTYLNLPGATTTEDGLWKLIEQDQSLIDRIKEIMETKEPTIILEEECDFYSNKYCETEVRRVNHSCFDIFGKLKGTKSYKLSVESSDCSSAYGWHIQRPDGSWFPFQEGEEIIVEFGQNGEYNITLEQENTRLYNLNIQKTKIRLDNSLTPCCSNNFTLIERICHDDICWKVFPNPAEDEVTIINNITTEESIDFNCYILDANGETKIYQRLNLRDDRFIFDISSLNSGKYFFYMDIFNNCQSVEFIKI